MMQITIYDSIKVPTEPDYQVTATWNEVVGFLMAFNQATAKDKVPMFNLWQLKTIAEGAEPGVNQPGTIRRCKNNAIGCWGLVLDYDAVKTIKEIEHILAGIEYVIYTTYSHSANKDKFRCVIPFDRLMSVAEFESKVESILELFPGVDGVSLSITQAMYMHSGPNQSLAYAKHHTGVILPADGFIAAAPKPQELVSLTQYTELMSDDVAYRYKEAVVRSLITCSGVHRGVRPGDGGALTLALICKSIDLTFPEYQAVTALVCDPDSCMQSPATQRAVWNSVIENKIRKLTRDKFIEKYGGQPVIIRSGINNNII